MITDKEYLFLSMLSYCNFSAKDYDKTILEYLKNNTKELNDIFDTLIEDNREVLLEYFKEIVDKWKVFYIDNRTSIKNGKSSSGFYSVVFQNEEKYILTFRGSEKFPLEDAYKDFIETDLMLGLGKIPIQFYEGIEVFNHLVDDLGIDIKKISITGHSLGGVIAQFVALNSNKTRDYIPITYTWNAVGIKRKNLITKVEYLDISNILAKNSSLSADEIEIFKGFSSDYTKIYEKIISKYEGEIFKKLKISFKIDEKFIKKLKKTPSLLKIYKILGEDRVKILEENENIYTILFDIKGNEKILEKSKKFYDNFNNNVGYDKKIFNYGHSQDFTNSVFNHLGTLYLVDNDFFPIVSLDEDRNPLSNFRLFTKSIKDKHLEDVFFPFFNNKGNFAKNLNLNFIASSFRKLLTMEYLLDRELLVYYYSLTKIDENIYQDIKSLILRGFEKSGENFLYRKQLIAEIEKMDFILFKEFWNLSLKKLPSPYKKQDIYDVFLFKNR